MRSEIAFASLALFAMTAPGTAYAQAETLQAGAGQAGVGQAGVDYAGFVELAGELGEYRQSRLLGWEEWDRQSRLHGAIILDTRSAAAFAQGHIRGAVNLPFSDFTEDKLAQIIADRQRPVFIYCNNNFADDEPPVPLKRLELALNIPTFINLYGYGYRNIAELGEVVALDDVDWVSPELRAQ